MLSKKTICRQKIISAMAMALCSLILLLALVCPDSAVAEEDATLRDFKAGDKLPSFKLTRIGGKAPEMVTVGDGKPTLIVFFSIRPAFRKTRSLALLSSLSDLAESYKSKINIIGIYSDDQEEDTVANYNKTSAPKIPIYSDPLKEVHNKYGVFMMPLVVMTDAKGNLHEVIPYTFNIRELIDGNCKLLLGEWTLDDLQKSMEPKELISKTDDEKEYIRRVNYGRIMQQKKMHAQAIREFSTAIKLNPKGIEGHVELGFAYLNTKEWSQAKSSFEEALSIDSESDDAIAGLGLTYFGLGELEKARIQLENAFIAPLPRLEVIITLAELYEKSGNNTKANRLNKLAISRLMTLYEQRWK